MKYRRLGRTGLEVSELCLGTMQFGWTADEAKSFRVLDQALGHGINFIDTADIYSRWAEDNPGGVSESILGRWLERGGVRRQEIVLATKVRGPMGEGPNSQGLSRQRVLRSIDESLLRLRTDYVDLYQLHWPDDDTPLEETMEALNDIVRSGKVRYLGLSNYPAWLTTKAAWIADTRGFSAFVSTQPRYNLIDRAPVERELAAVCLDQGLGILAWSPLGGGFLTGKYRPGGTVDSARADGVTNRYANELGWKTLEALDQVAKESGRSVPQVSLAWLLSRPAMTAAIIGANDTAQLDELIPASGAELDPQLLDTLTEVTAWAPGS